MQDTAGTTAFGYPDLRTLLVAGTGENELLTDDAAVLDTPFPDLGYDSLAMLEVATLIEQRHGVAIPDDTMADLTTPRTVIDFVNTATAVV